MLYTVHFRKRSDWICYLLFWIQRLLWENSISRRYLYKTRILVKRLRDSGFQIYGKGWFELIMLFFLWILQTSAKSLLHGCHTKDQLRSEKKWESFRNEIGDFFSFRNMFSKWNWQLLLFFWNKFSLSFFTSLVTLI